MSGLFKNICIFVYIYWQVDIYKKKGGRERVAVGHEVKITLVLLSHCQNFGFYSEQNEKAMISFEKRSSHFYSLKVNEGVRHCGSSCMLLLIS